ncbi:PQQ-dependent sugar dehydrogenase [Mesorhizobium sp. Root552]|uniref:PQQ-dependent sugar dehydrogenase n=1 Tax=Mesorhizobium sp. Root552 TaxID=1736555 RepID=UPI000B28DBED|nr:beta-propeller fold lactonase family protein [Mesorhizobium sp. Root552]
MKQIATLTLPFLLAATVALAQDASVLKGEAAFGDWRADQPGVRRLIVPDDLQAPFATDSASNGADRAAMPPDAGPKLPPGFAAEMIASGIRNPRALRIAPNGDIFVADSRANQIRVYRLDEGSAKPVEQAVFASGLRQPYGIAFYPADKPEWAYVANSGSVVRFAYKSGDLEASGDAEVVVKRLPGGGHWTRDITFSPDGKTLYVSVGSASNVAEGIGEQPSGGIEAWAERQPLGALWGNEENRAAVLAFDPDGGNERIAATGLRNWTPRKTSPLTARDDSLPR